ncbi:MAG: cadherin domain-containing protein, partial [Ekhidna sp.]|nr:cadherin domain-containing protein [Ekhidna sp.]
APAFSSGSFILTIGEDAATDANVGAAVAAVDPDEDGVTYTLTGEDSGDFSIDGNGQITVASTLDRETTSSYTLTVTATDDDATNSLSATATVTINVTDVNDNAPKITSDNAKKVAENTTTVLTVVATDADANTTLTYSLSGGSDRSSFSIDAGSGALTFNSAPDFEAKGSAAGNNTYVVQVTANDGTSDSSPQTITVTVTDVDEVLGVPSAEGMELYPNPASVHFRLTGISGQLSGVTLIGTAGKAVRSYPVSKDGLYDLSGLNEGLFFVFTEGDGGRKAVGRIVIRK